MSKVIRTGTIYRMVGFLVMAVVSLAIAVPTIAEMMLKQSKQQDAEVASRPKADQPSAPPPGSMPAPAPQTPVVFGAPTMAAAPVDYAKLQQQAQAKSASSASSNAPSNAASTPSYQPSLPAPSADLGIDPNVTAPRVIEPKPTPQTIERPRNWQRSAVQ
jgi:hypothetical protein